MNRVIHDPSELNALPVKAVLLDEGGWPVWRDPHEGWCASNGTHDIPADLLIADGAPLTILHDPSAPAPALTAAPSATRAVAHDGPGHPYGDAAYCGGCLAEREANQ